MDTSLNNVLKNSSRFYKSESRGIIIALFDEQNSRRCYTIKCFGLDCNCSETNSCDLYSNENVQSVYSDAVSITKDEFIEHWTTCQLK